MYNVYILQYISRHPQRQIIVGLTTSVVLVPSTLVGSSLELCMDRRHPQRQIIVGLISTSTW